MRGYKYPSLYWLSIVPLASIGSPVIFWLSARERHTAMLVALAVQVVLLIVQISSGILRTRRLKADGNG